jgi:hypothetical protein
MATVAEIKEIIAGLREQDAVAKRDIKEIQNSILDLNVKLSTTTDTATISQIKAEIRKLRSELQDANATVERLTTELRNAGGELARAENAAAAPPAAPPVSAGETVPPPAAPASTATASAQIPSNADAFDPDKTTDTGLNAPTKTLDTTQSSPPSTATPGAAAPSIASDAKGTDFGALNEDAGSSAASPVASPARDSGKGAPGDDNSVRSSINAAYGSTAATALIPQDNVLDKYSSYTYNISIYIASPQAYAKLLQSPQKTTNGMQLLMQSGGAPQGTMGTAQKDSNSADQAVLNTVGELGINTDQAAPSAASRNQFFPLDYYIDDVKIRSLLMGKGTRGAHNAVELGFRISEPNGISLLDNLYFACQEQAKAQGATKSPQNYAAQNYLMVIRFYGYDQDGNLVNVNGEVVNFDQTMGPTAIVEKFIPFQFTGIKFRVANKLTEYECSAVCPQNGIATGQARGVIPYNVEVTATTLKELLSGNAKYTTNNAPVPDSSRANTSAETAPPVASAAPNPTIVSGLAAALNKFEQERVPGTFTIPDEYEIIIVDDAMQNAKTQPPRQDNKLTSNATVGMVIPADAAQAKLSSKQTVNFNSKNAAILAGTSIVQFIDQAVRNSTYIYDQQLTSPAVDKEGNEVDDKDTPNGKPAGPFAWYRIGTQVTPKGYDPKRNDYAYKITYQVSMYKVYGVRSDYFPVSRKNGVHKQYKHWFTGQNSQILTFEQDFNYLFYNTVNATNRTSTPYGREQEKNSWQTRSNISDQGQPGKTNEPGANAAAYLYSPADQARVKMSIVGDPAWLQQGELWNGLQGNKIYSNNFLTDGTINFENQEVLFEIEFNTPVDYDMDTGLMNPNQNVRPNYNVYVYKAVEVTSNFSRGRFTQDLDGVLITFPAKATKKTDITDLNSESTRRFSNPANNNSRTQQSAGTDIIDPNSLGELGINTDQLTGGGQSSAAFAATDPRRVDLENTAAAPPPDPPTSGTQQVGIEPNVSFGSTPMAADPEPPQQIARDY